MNKFNQKKIDRHIQYIDDKILEYQNQLDLQDGELDKKTTQTKIAYQESKKERYRNIEKQLQESGQTELSLTDPDARSVVLHKEQERAFHRTFHLPEGAR